MPAPYPAPPPRSAGRPVIDLPEPDAEAKARCAQVLELLRRDIEEAGGWISFARYMDRVLYAPGLGYYTGGARKFGPAGDFVTAPELSPLFGRSLASTARAVLDQSGGDILELGAGSGRLAADLLLELERHGALPEHYRILELSGELRQRQAETLAEAAPHLLPRVTWLDTLPERIRGLVLGNEVLDAVPPHVLHWTESGLMERGVAWSAGPVWAERPASPELAAQAAVLPVEGDYVSEVNPAATALVASLAERLEAGALLFIDYGYPMAEYYHPQRCTGTLMAHYRHRSLDDPFFLPGLADLTAHVDFSAVARAGEEAGLDLLGYTSQAHFLTDAGLLDLMLETTPMSPEYLRAAVAVQRLLQPSEMGELFKVIGLGRGVEEGLPGFRRGDRRGAL
ncbi:MAG: SAM-dependent methyltransferase [Pseudomonadota bacterium]